MFLQKKGMVGWEYKVPISIFWTDWADLANIECSWVSKLTVYEDGWEISRAFISLSLHFRSETKVPSLLSALCAIVPSDRQSETNQNRLMKI